MRSAHRRTTTVRDNAAARRAAAVAPIAAVPLSAPTLKASILSGMERTRMPRFADGFPAKAGANDWHIVDARVEIVNSSCMRHVGTVNTPA